MEPCAFIQHYMKHLALLYYPVRLPILGVYKDIHRNLPLRAYYHMRCLAFLVFKLKQNNVKLYPSVYSYGVVCELIYQMFISNLLITVSAT